MLVKVKSNRLLLNLNCILLKLKFKNISHATINNQQQVKQYKVVFFGSDLFSVKILNALKEIRNQPNAFKNRITDIKVVTSIKLKTHKHAYDTIDRASKEENPIVNECKKSNIEYHLWSNVAKMDDYASIFPGFNVAIVASFGHLIPSKVIDFFQL